MNNKLELSGKNIVIGVTGGIAVYKTVGLISDLKKLGANIHVIMTKNATEFVSPLTFETISKNKVYTDTFDRNFSWDVHHVSLAKKADCFLICPATANIIAKMAYGIADDMLSTTCLACSCPKIVAPAMNTGMYENPATQRNLQTIKEFGVNIIEPESGLLACKDIGKGRLANIETIKSFVLDVLCDKKDLNGLKVLVTAGATCESLDPVRFITNHSSGKMGYNLAKVAKMRGADVTLIKGNTNISDPVGVDVIKALSAESMFEKVKEYSQDADIIIKAAAVADYTPANVAENKIKKNDGNLVVEFKRTKDILKYLGENKKDNQFICGFSMETTNLVENSEKKLVKKNADMIIANNLKTEGAGFGVDTNVATIITKDGCVNLDVMTKYQLSHTIFDYIIKYIK